MEVHTSQPELTDRAKQLLAYRFASPILLVGAGLLGFAIPQMRSSDLLGTVFGLTLFILVGWGLAYWVRLQNPNRDRYVEPGTLPERPRFANRAAVAGGVAVLALFTVIAISIVLDPFHVAAHRSVVPMLWGAIVAGLAVGGSVFLLAPILYLPVRSTKGEFNMSLGSISFIVVLFWVLGVVNEVKRHAIGYAILYETWSASTVIVAIVLSAKVYAWILPEAEPFRFLARASK